MNNYPPGFTGMPEPTDIRIECPNGHVWYVDGYEELGALNLADENEDLSCPECGEEGEF